jgi:protein tyrosine kinase modulator
MDERRKNDGLHGLLEIWSRRKWLAMLAFVAPLTAALSLALFLPDIYRATATVLVGRPQVSETFVKSSVTSELETRLPTISQEILSRSRLQDMITHFNLYPDFRERASAEEVITRMRRDIQVEQLKETQQMGGRATIAVTISYRSSDPETAAEVTNTLAALYIEENLKMRELQASQTAEFLQTQLEEMKKKLDEEERRVGAFKEQHGGELPEQQDANLATLQRLNAELRLNSENQMRVMERMEREELTRQLTDASSLGHAGDSMSPLGGPDALAARLTKLNRELLELRTRYSEKYPDVVRLKTEIAAIERKLAEKQPDESNGDKPGAQGKSVQNRLKKVRSGIEVELNVLKEEEQALRKSIALYQRRVETAPHREQELQELSRDYKTMKELYNTLLQRYKEARVAESMEQGRQGDQFRVLDQAIVPDKPAGPNRAKLLLIGLFLSLLLAAGTVASVEHFDPSFHSVEDLRAFTKVPVFVSIPRIVTDTDTRQMRRRFSLGSAAVLLGLALIAMTFHAFAHGNTLLASLLTRGPS